MPHSTDILTDASASATSRAPKYSDPILSIGKTAAWVSAILCLIPLPLVIVVATSSNWVQGPWLGGPTLHWILDAWGRVSGNFTYSLRLALLVLVIDLAISFPAAWLLARRTFFGRGMALAITQMPLAIPGIALAIALILSYPALRPSGVLLIGGHVLYTAPFMIATLVPALGNPKVREQELVATTLGASAVYRFFRITIPGVRTAIFASLILVYSLSIGEFNVSFFLFSPTQQPLPVELYSGYITNRLEVAAASTLWFLILVIPAAMVLERFGGAKVSSA